jgi:hypothetical protein
MKTPNLMGIHPIKITTIAADTVIMCLDQKTITATIIIALLVTANPMKTIAKAVNSNKRDSAIPMSKLAS